MKYFYSCAEILVINWTLVSIALFSFARWTKVVALQWKRTFFTHVRWYISANL